MVYRGGMHVRDAGINVTRPLVSLEASRDAATLTTAPPFGWLVRRRTLFRSQVRRVRATTSSSWMASGVEFDTTTQGFVTFWTRHPSDVLDELSELGWPVRGSD